MGEMIDEKLEERISELLDELNNYSPDSQEYREVVHNLNVLYKMKADKEKDLEEARVAYSKIDLEKRKLDIEEARIEADAALSSVKTDIEIDRVTIERDKLDIEKERIEADKAINEIRSKNDKKAKIIEVATKAGEILLTGIFYGIWMKKGFKFEETGTYTSPTFRNLWSKFKFRK